MTPVQIIVLAVITVMMAEAFPGTKRLAETLAAWSARSKYAGDPERAKRRAEEWPGLVRVWPSGAVLGLFAAFGFAISSLMHLAVQRSRMIRRYRREAKQERRELTHRKLPSKATEIFSKRAQIPAFSIRDSVTSAFADTGLYRALRFKEFRRYIVGSIISDVGTWVRNTAQMLLVYRLTHSILAVGLVTAAQFSSLLILGPWTGVVVSRVGPVRVLITGQVVSAAITAAFACLEFKGKLTELLIITGVLGIGVANTFSLPGRSVVVCQLVPQDTVKSALGMDSFSYHIGRVLGSMLGIFMITILGFGWVLSLTSLIFVMSAAQLSRIRLTGHAVAALGRRTIRSGLQIAWRHRRNMIFIMMAAATSVATVPITMLGLILDGSGSILWSGFFLSAFGVGALLGLMLPVRSPSIRGAMAYQGLLGITVCSFAISPIAWVSALTAVPAGMTAMLAGRAIRTLLIRNVSKEDVIRIASLLAAVVVGAVPIVAPLDGFLAELIGPRIATILMALPTIIPMLVFIFRSSIGKPVSGELTLDVAARIYSPLSVSPPAT